MFDIIKEILISEREFIKSNSESLKKAFVYIKNNLIDFDGNMSLPVDSLIERSNTINDSNKITLRKVNVKPYGFDKMYVEKDLIEDDIYQITSQFN